MNKFDYLKTSDACIKCGKCIQVCTIYDIKREETNSPRGFLDLLGAYERGDLELDKNAKKIFESCFLCTNCVQACPNSLATDTMIENVRADIAEKFGMPFYKKAIFWLLGHRKVLDIAAKMGYVFKSCAFAIRQSENFENAKIDKGMKPRFSLPFLNKERFLPSVAKRSFLNSHPDFIDNGGDKTVGIFIGCMGNYTYTNIGEGLLKICKAVGINANLMKAQKCCGAPAYFTGDMKSTKKWAKFNIEYFEKELENLDAIIIPEATCSAMIRVDYEHLFWDESQWQQRAKKLSKKIFLATEYFEKFTKLKEILAQKGMSESPITYHDPCHARKMQGIYKEPRALLSQNFKIIEQSEADVCCGFGGVTMQTSNYHLARKSGLKKAKLIEETGVKVVSAECSACKMQINNSLNLIDSKTKCLNPIELIASKL